MKLLLGLAVGLLGVLLCVKADTQEKCTFEEKLRGSWDATARGSIQINEDTFNGLGRSFVCDRKVDGMTIIRAEVENGMDLVTCFNYTILTDNLWVSNVLTSGHQVPVPNTMLYRVEDVCNLDKAAAHDFVVYYKPGTKDTGECPPHIAAHWDLHDIHPKYANQIQCSHNETLNTCKESMWEVNATQCARETTLEGVTSLDCLHCMKSEHGITYLAARPKGKEQLSCYAIWQDEEGNNMKVAGLMLDGDGKSTCGDLTDTKTWSSRADYLLILSKARECRSNESGDYNVPVTGAATSVYSALSSLVLVVAMTICIKNNAIA